MTDSWENHAYPLKRVSISLQGTKHSSISEIVRQLDTVKERLLNDDINGLSHDDDFGYVFDVSTTEHTTLFNEPSSFE